MHNSRLEYAKVNKQENRNGSVEALARRASRGDDDALYTLLERITDTVIFYAAGLLDNIDDAEDVAQESLLYLCEKIKDLREAKTFRVWLNRIVSSKARDHIRKNTQHGAVYNLDDYVNSVIEEKREFIPQEYAESEELRRAVSDLVDTLSPRQYEAIYLYYYQGFRVNEIAVIMGIGHQSVTTHLATAHEKLRRDAEKQKAGVGSVLATYSIGGLMHGVFERKLQISNARTGDLSSRLLEQCKERMAAQPGAAPAAAVKKSLYWPVMGALTALMVSAALLAGVHMGAAEPVPVSSEAATESAFTGEVIFRGGVKRGVLAHLNPIGASVRTTDGSLLTQIGWEITPLDADIVLYSGESDSPDKAIQKLRNSGKAGSYMLRFEVYDPSGIIYTIGRSFQCKPE